MTSCYNNITYEIGWDQKGKKKKRIVHVNNLKPHCSDDFEKE